MTKVPSAIHSGLHTTNNIPTEPIAPKPLVTYGSSPINSDEESPPPKRSRQGTIGAEGHAQIMAGHVHLQQQPSTRKCSIQELLGLTHSYGLYSVFGEPGRGNDRGEQWGTKVILQVFRLISKHLESNQPGTITAIPHASPSCVVENNEEKTSASSSNILPWQFLISSAEQSKSGIVLLYHLS